MSSRQAVTYVPNLPIEPLKYRVDPEKLSLPAMLEAITGLELFQEAEVLLEKWKYPDPYKPPTAPGGSKYERNIPPPILDPPPHFTL
ncbi:hypothetical protein G7Y79_00003g008490 [Physcia stellaris]|nr:hypothetical protein G7Y79_00003g008490 [Physcia stellaris]